MSWRLGILSAVLAWLFLAGPAVLAAAERADCGIEVRNGTRTKNLAHLTRTLLSQQGFDVIQIGNHIDFGAEATVIYYRTEAKKVARALQAEIFPGARIEESSSLKNGADLKVLLGSDLLAQPRILARLLGEEMAAPPPAVKAPTPGSGPPPRSAAAKGTTAPVIVSAPAKAEPVRPQSQAPPPVPAAASAAKSGVMQRHNDSRGVPAAAERADSGIEVRNGTRTPNLARHTRTLLSQQGFDVVQIGNHIDFGVEATVIYYRTEAEKVARLLQSEIFPGARIEASSSLKNGVDLKVLLGHDLEVQPRIMARLLGEEMAAPPPAVKAPTPESGPPPRSTAAKETAAPVIVSAPETTEPNGPPSQAPPPVPAAASAAKTGASQLLTDSRVVVHIGNVAPSQPTPSQTDSPSGVTELMMVEPWRGRSLPPWLSEQVEETYIPEADLDAIQKACQGLALGEAQAHEFNGIIAAAGQAAAEKEAAEVAVNNNNLSVRQVSQDQGVIPAPALQPTATQTAEAAAAGDIRRYCDARDVAHTGNAPPGQPTPSQPDSPSAVREAVLVEPRRSRNHHVRLVGQTEETYTPASDLDVIQKACQDLSRGEAQAHEFDAIIAAAGQAAAEKEAAEVAVNNNNLSVRQVSQDPGVIPTPAPQPAAPQTGEAAAPGDIRRYRDARGVLHIGNVAPSQPTPSQPDSPRVVREAMLAEPRRSGSRHVRMVGQTEETYNPESHLDAIQKACQDLSRGEAQAHEFDGIIAAVEQAAAEKEAAEVAVDYNYLPVRQVFQDQGGIPAPAPQPAAPQTAEAAAPGNIRRYRDARGIVHLSNAAPGAEDLGPAVQMAQSPNNQSGEARQSGQPAPTQPRLPFRQAAWSPEDRRLATLPTTSSPVKPAAPSEPSLIRRYRDSKGVIHISNANPESRETPPPAGLMARSSAAAGSEPQPSRPLPAAVETAGGLAWRPAAWNGEGGIQALKRVKDAPSQTAEVITDGGIRRYRDKKGTINIKTVEYPLPPGVVLPPRQAGSSSMAPMAAAPTAPAVSNPPANPTTLSGAGARITAFKDAKGRLRITTELPPAVPGKTLPPMPVYAELEPIILEAAQIHRLPPTLIRAVIKSESNFCSWAVSPKGAMGLMQLMPGTADFLGVREPFNPRDNILGGCRYLRELIDLFGGNLPLALASYNAGFQRVIDCGYQIPSIKETQDFVTAVMGRYMAEEKRGRQPS